MGEGTKIAKKEGAGPWKVTIEEIDDKQEQAKPKVVDVMTIETVTTTRHVTDPQINDEDKNENNKENKGKKLAKTKRAKKREKEKQEQKWEKERTERIVSGGLGVRTEEEEAFRPAVGFPTNQRPFNYTRTISEDYMEEVNKWWIKEGKKMMGDYELDLEQQERVKRLLYTWKDLFVTNPEHMPVTDLVVHTIPTYATSRPVKVKSIMYSPP